MNRILLASHSALLTGMPQVLYNIASNLDRTRFEPLVLFPEDGPIIERYEAAGVSTQVIDIGDSRWGQEHIPMLEALCIVRKIDLIHANTIHGFPFLVAAEKCGIPGFWYIQEMLRSGLPFNINETEFKIAVGLASQIGTASQACVGHFVEYCQSLGFHPPEPVVIHNGIRIPKQYHPYEPGDPISLLSIGNLQPHKGYHVLVEALQNVSSINSRFVSTILGDGNLYYLGEVWNQAEQAGIEDRMHFLSAVLDVGEYIENCDIVIHPSLVENFSLSIAEAMAYGKPVIASDVGGTGELMVNGETGLLVPPNDPEALTKAILRFMEEPEFARQSGEKARERIEKNFSVERQARQIEEIYSSLLSRAARSPRQEKTDGTEIYRLMSEGLISANEKIHQLDVQTDDALKSLEKLRAELDHAWAVIENTREIVGDNREYFSKYVATVENDIRNLEAVVNNLLQKLPFRIYRKMGALFRRGSAE